MIRISYLIDGIRYEGIINPRTTCITDEMLEYIDNIYLFKKNRTITGTLAYRYARRLRVDEYIY